MKGLIRVEDYKIHCIIGVYPHERKEEREISIDLEIECDFELCAKSDDVKDALDYDQIMLLCRELIQKRRYNLLETLAYEVLEALFQQFPILRARIKVKKKGVVPLAAFVAVELEKTAT